MKTDNWRKDALCKGKETSWFYPEPNEKGTAKQIREIKAFCRVCPVILNCLDTAIENNETFGVWGGMTPAERSRIRKSRNTKVSEKVITVVKKNDNSEV